MKRSLPSMIAGTILIVILLLYMITYQVRFTEVAVVRTFGEIEPPGLLFSSTEIPVDELGGDQVPAKLRALFQEHQEESLSPEAAWKPIKENNEWKIVEKTREYIVRKVGKKVSVFDPTQHESKDVITTPGLKWKLPWPIQKVDKFDNRIHVTATTGEETPTRDGKNVIVTTTIGWRIYDPYLFSIRCSDEKDAESKIQTRVRNDQKTVISQYDFANFVSTDPNELKYDQIEKEIMGAVKASARELYGVEVESIGISKLALPSGITQTVFEAMKKERQAVAARYTSEGESTAKKMTDTAEGIAETIKSFADLQAAEIVAKGKEQAAAYNDTFRQDEGLAMYLLEIENLAKMLKDRTTLILEANHRPFELLKNPTTATSATTQPATGGGKKGEVALQSALPEMINEK